MTEVDAPNAFAPGAQLPCVDGTVLHPHAIGTVGRLHEAIDVAEGWSKLARADTRRRPTRTVRARVARRSWTCRGPAADLLGKDKPGLLGIVTQPRGAGHDLEGPRGGRGDGELAALDRHDAISCFGIGVEDGGGVVSHTITMRDRRRSPNGNLNSTGRAR